MIVVDTGPLVALMNNRDNMHAECRELLENAPGPLLVPAPHDPGRFEPHLRAGRQVRRPTLGTVDASVVAVAERFPITAVATLDRKHFSIIRSKAGQLLLVP
ncbi:hypothetical protein IU433_27130 [Nocardia puris]|uniref:hypothetical protein n=1 Tax=Nocardia puris TaxID=208602 RepID=UPI001893E6D6|nr:hypothetical protein [Nocardia puris]MBF6213067.1 hypothetical protein [Nocardia puris]MBF6462691.1 hypothetical protein [Nocardia puris]